MKTNEIKLPSNGTEGEHENHNMFQFSLNTTIFRHDNLVALLWLIKLCCLTVALRTAQTKPQSKDLTVDAAI